MFKWFPNVYMVLTLHLCIVIYGPYSREYVINYIARHEIMRISFIESYSAYIVNSLRQIVEISRD